MNKAFSIDLRTITLGEFQKMLEGIEFSPEKAGLKEALTARFESLAGAGVGNLADLINKTNTDKKVSALAVRTGLSEDYLNMMKREAGSMISKPVNLDKYPGIDTTLVHKLLQKGIKNSRQLFDKTAEESDRAAICTQLSINSEAFMELIELADLTRINGVGPIFAVMLRKSGIHSIKDFAEADASGLYARIVQINKNGEFTSPGITEKDLRYCARFAGLLNQQTK